MLELIIDDTYKLDLQDDFSITMNYLSPLFNNRGSTSYTSKALLTANNKKIINYSHRINAIDIKRNFNYTLIFQKVPFESGSMKITYYNNDYFEFYLKPNETDFYSVIKDKKLNVLTNLPSIPPSTNGIINNWYPTIKYVNFPVFNNKIRQIYDGYLEHYQNFYYYAFYDTGENANPNNIKSIDFSSLTPFLFLDYVIEKLLIFFNYKISENGFFNVVQLRQLVLYNNTVYRPTVDGYCDLNKHLPPILISDLLCMLKDLFGIVFIIKNHPAKEVKIKLLKDIINDYKNKDFNNKVSKFYQKENDLAEKKGYSLKFSEDEEYFNTGLRKNNFFKKATVTVYSELSNVNFKPWDIVFVDNDRIYYQKQNNGTWLPYSNEFPNEVIEPCEFEINTTFSPAIPYKHSFDNTFPGSTEYPKQWITPRVDTETFFYNENNETCPLKLMFWRGLQRDSRGKQYPYGSSSNYNYDNSIYGGLILKWQSDRGFYEQFLKDYVSWSVNRKTSVSFEKIMSAEELRDIDWDVKHLINGNEYLLDKIGVTYTKKYIKPAKINAFLV